jgi:hypothetical protein
MKLVTSLISLLFLLGIFLGNPCIAQDKEKFSSEELLDLTFKNCSEVTTYLSTNENQLSPFEKLQFAESFARILKLQNPSLPTSIHTSGMFQNYYSPLDISRVLEPSREEDAKSCAIKNMYLLTPQSVPFLPEIYRLASDKTNPTILRKQAITTAHLMISFITESFDLNLKNLLLRNIEKNANIMQEIIALPLFVNLAGYFQKDILDISLKNPQLIKNIIPSFAANDPDGSLSIPLLRSEMEHIELNLQRKILLSLSSYPSQATPQILEMLGDIIGREEIELKKSTFSLLKKYTENQSTYKDHYHAKLFPEELLENLLLELRKNDHENQRVLFKLLSEVELTNEYTLCQIEEKEVPSPLLGSSPPLEYTEKLLLRIMCPISDETIKNLLSNLPQASYSNKIITTLALLKKSNSNISVLNKIRNNLTKKRAEGSTREFEQLASLTLALLAHAPPSGEVNAFISLALENLETSGELPPLTSLIFDDKKHPAVLFMISHGHTALSKIGTLLLHKSSLVRHRALSILANPKVPYSSSLTSQLLQLLNDDELEIRRTAFQLLKRNIKNSDIKLLAKHLKNKNPHTRFYTTLLFLNDDFLIGKNSFTSIQISTDTLFEKYLENANSVTCEERTKNIPAITPHYLLSSSKSIKNKYAQLFIECSNENKKLHSLSLEALLNLQALPSSSLNNLFEKTKLFKTSILSSSSIKILLTIFSKSSDEMLFTDSLRIILKKTGTSEQIEIFKWLNENDHLIEKKRPMIHELLLSEYPNISTNELNRIYLKIINQEPFGEILFEELARTNLDADELYGFMKLISRNELEAVLEQISQRESLNAFFISFKSALCRHLQGEYHEVNYCNNLFTQSDPVFLDHPKNLTKSIRFHFENYFLSADCESLPLEEIFLCKKTKQKLLGKGITQLEMGLLLGVWDYIEDEHTSMILLRALPILDKTTSHSHLKLLSRIMRHAIESDMVK